MPSTAELVCVAPKQVREFWPFAGPMIRAATSRLRLFEQIERDVISGNQLLWIIWDGAAIRAAGTTHLSDGICTVTACSGSHLKSWIHVFGAIQKYAEAERCVVRIQGRGGWKRALARAGFCTKDIIFDERAA